MVRVVAEGRTLRCSELPSEFSLVLKKPIEKCQMFIVGRKPDIQLKFYYFVSDLLYFKAALLIPVA